MRWVANQTTGVLKRDWKGEKQREVRKWCGPGGWVRLKDIEDFLVVEYLFPNTNPVPLTE